MRLDKFLKVARLIKRRTIAKELADKGRIQCGEAIAKPSTEVKIGDVITIKFGTQRTLVIEVAKLTAHANKDDALTLYNVISDKRHNLS